MFGTLDGTNGGGIVRNLTISNARMSVSRRTGRYSAIVAARAVSGALIENCTVAHSSVLSDSTAVGILAGEFSESVIRNCTVTAATVEGSGGTNNTAQWGTGGRHY